MKVLFLTQDFIIEPLGLMYLSASLRKRGHEVKIIKVHFPGYDLNALSSEKVHRYEVVGKGGLIEKIKAFSPQLLGYSVTTGMHRYYLDLNREIKRNFNILSVWGGPHPTFFPEIIGEEGVDIVLRGEGEEAMAELAEKIEATVDYGGIKNLWVKREKEIVRNELRPLNNDLDNLSPDRELFYHLFPSLRFNPIKNFMASRGCPYDCSYCFNHVYRKLYGPPALKVRYRNPAKVIEEIKAVKKNYPLEIVYFQDDTFNLNREWLITLLESYRREIALPFHAHLRPDLIDEKLIKIMAASHGLSVTMAFETADDHIRHNLLKRSMSKDQMLRAARLMRRHNIKFRIENMAGLPGGDMASDWQTLNLNIKARPSIGWASLYQPYPRTALGEFCKRENLVDSLDLNYIRPSFFQSSILKLKHKNRVENLQKLFSLTVEWPFLRPFVRQLIKLPPNRFFNWVYVRWKRYAYNRRLYRIASGQENSSSLRFLMVALGGLGNIIMLTPALRELKEKFPHSSLTVAVLKGRGGKEVLEANPFVDEIFVYDPLEFRGLNKFRLWHWLWLNKFEASLTMYPTGRNIFELMAWLSGIPWRLKHVSIKNDRLDNFLHNILIKIQPQYHHQDYNRELVYVLEKIIYGSPRRREIYSGSLLPLPRPPLEIYLKEKEREFRDIFFRQASIRPGDLVLALHPGSQPETSQKRWPVERFALLSDRIYERYRGKVIIFGTAEEEAEMQKFIKATRAPVIKAGGFNIREVASVLQGCNLLIANDSGLMHLSQAMGTPLLALFGPSNPLKVGPLNHNSVVLRTAYPLSCPGVKNDEMCCSFLHQNRCPYKKDGIVECLFYLSVEEVMAAVEKILVERKE